MKRVEENGDWTLMCPNECPGLADTYGKKFENYTRSTNQKVKRKPLKLKNFGLRF